MKKVKEMEYDEAIRILKNALDIDKDHVDALVARGAA